MKTIEESEKPIIEQCLVSAHDLLTSYWGDIQRVRDARDKLVAIRISFKVDCTGLSPVVKTKMAFSRHYHDVREETVDLGQTEFHFFGQA